MLDIVAALNGPRPRTMRPDKPPIIRRLPHGEVEIELWSLVSRWMDSGPNLRVLLDGDSSLKDKVLRRKTILYAGPEGQGYLDWVPDFVELGGPGRRVETLPEQALTYFIDLITNPEWGRLAGPCERCSDYFLKETKHKRKFCSRKCTSASTATEHVKLGRERDKAIKIEKAKRLIDEWADKQPRGFTWKKWVCRGPEITIQWLTRAVNKGDVRAPI